MINFRHLVTPPFPPAWKRITICGPCCSADISIVVMALKATPRKTLLRLCVLAPFLETIAGSEYSSHYTRNCVAYIAAAVLSRAPSVDFPSRN